MIDELKPCPFCGKPPNIWNHRSEFGISTVCDVYCKQDNHSVIVTGNSKEEAIEAWNTRTEPDTLPEWILKILKNKLNEIGTDKTVNPITRVCGIKILNWVLSLRKPEEKE